MKPKINYSLFYTACFNVSVVGEYWDNYDNVDNINNLEVCLKEYDCNKVLLQLINHRPIYVFRLLKNLYNYLTIDHVNLLIGKLGSCYLEDEEEKALYLKLEKIKIDKKIERVIKYDLMRSRNDMSISKIISSYI